MPAVPFRTKAPLVTRLRRIVFHCLGLAVMVVIKSGKQCFVKAGYFCYNDSSFFYRRTHGESSMKERRDFCPQITRIDANRYRELTFRHYEVSLFQLWPGFLARKMGWAHLSLRENEPDPMQDP